jgi:hypothetical protein
MELEITRLLRESPANPRRHLDQERVRRYAEVLDQLPPGIVFALEDQTLLLADGYHRVAAQQAGRTIVRAEVRVGTKAEAIQFAVDVAQAEAGVSADQARDAIRRYSRRQEQGRALEQLTRRHPRNGLSITLRLVTWSAARNAPDGAVESVGRRVSGRAATSRAAVAFAAKAGYAMPAMASASCRSLQARIATTRPSRTVNTS